MNKRALLTVVGLVVCCLSSSAQEMQRSVLFSLSRLNTRADLLGRLDGAYYNFPSLTLSDGRLFSLFDASDWVEAIPADFLPALSAEVPARARTASTRDSADKAVKLQPKVFDYVHGEVGGLYGTTLGGKFSREVEAGYILGEMGNDKTQISIGGFYEHSSGHVPRWGR
jgi:hypothetical protein